MIHVDLSWRLRERTDDIPLLVAHFVQRFAERQGKCIEEIPDATIDTLRHYACRVVTRQTADRLPHAVLL